MPSWNNQSPACLHHVHKTEWRNKWKGYQPLRAKNKRNDHTTRCISARSGVQLLYSKRSRTQTDKSRDFLSNSLRAESSCNTHPAISADCAHTQPHICISRRLSFVRQKCAAIFFDFWMEKSSQRLVEKNGRVAIAGADRATWLGKLSSGSVSASRWCAEVWFRRRLPSLLYCAPTIPNGYLNAFAPNSTTSFYISGPWWEN